MMENLSFLSLFLLLTIQKTTKKSVNTDFRLFKPVQITAHTNREFNQMHLEARTLVLVWMDMTPSLMMMNRVLLRMNPKRRDIKGLHIPLR